MKIISGFFVYKAYVTYKSHFNQTSSDISKYEFNLFDISYDTFLKTKGIHYYDKLAKMIQKEKDLISLLIAVFMDNPNTWIGDIYMNYRYYIEKKEERENRISNIHYTFKSECIRLIEDGMKFDNTLGEYLLDKFIKSDITLETFIILKKIFNITLDNNINYDYLYKGKYYKYELLLRVDIEKYKNILKEAIMTSRD